MLLNILPQQTFIFNLFLRHLTARRLVASLAFVLLPREIQRVLKPSDVVVLARITERQMDSGSWPAQIRPPPCFCRE